MWRVGCFRRRQGQNGMHACLQSTATPSLVREPAAQPWPGARQDPRHLASSLGPAGRCSRAVPPSRQNLL